MDEVIDFSVLFHFCDLKTRDFHEHLFFISSVLFPLEPLLLLPDTIINIRLISCLVMDQT